MIDQMMHQIVDGYCEYRIRQTAMEKHRALEADTLAKTIWAEGYGEKETMEAVAEVVMNRLAIAEKRGKYWWGNSIIQICGKPFQFACWNKDHDIYGTIACMKADDARLTEAMEIARAAMDGELENKTHGATHYHAAGQAPYWIGRNKPIAVVGRLVFYRVD